MKDFRRESAVNSCFPAMKSMKNSRNITAQSENFSFYVIPLDTYRQLIVENNYKIEMKISLVHDENIICFM